MNIQQYITNPELISSLTQPQKLQVFQQLKQYQQQLQQEKIKLETELEFKTKEQQDLFTQLKQETHKETLADIKEFITSKQSEFDTELASITHQFKEIQ